MTGFPVFFFLLAMWETTPHPRRHSDPPNLGFCFFSFSPESACKGGPSPRRSLHGGVEPGHQPLTAELGCGAGSASSSGPCWSQPRSALPGRPRPCRSKVRRRRRASAGTWPSAAGWARLDVMCSAGQAPSQVKQTAPGLQEKRLSWLGPASKRSQLHQRLGCEGR